MPRPSENSRELKSARQKKREAPVIGEELIQTSFRLPRRKWQNLQHLSISERLSVQSIIVSALEAEFSKRGLDF